MVKSFLAQIRANLPIFLCILMFVFFILGFVLALHFWAQIPVRYLTSDVSVLASAPPYIGFLSQFGILLWAASVSVCMFGAMLFYQKAESSTYFYFLSTGGIFTAVLAFDDLFLLHEKVFPYIGIPELLIYSVYAGVLVFFLWRFRVLILNETRYILLGVALVFFALSVSIDIVIQQEYIFEDGSKFAGIFTWLVYFCYTSKELVHKFFRVEALSEKRHIEEYVHK